MCKLRGFPEQHYTSELGSRIRFFGAPILIAGMGILPVRPYAHTTAKNFWPLIE